MLEKTEGVPQLADATYAHTLVIKIISPCKHSTLYLDIFDRHYLLKLLLSIYTLFEIFIYIAPKIEFVGAISPDRGQVINILILRQVTTKAKW